MTSSAGVNSIIDKRGSCRFFHKVLNKREIFCQRRQISGAQNANKRIILISELLNWDDDNAFSTFRDELSINVAGEVKANAMSAVCSSSGMFNRLKRPSISSLEREF